MRMRSTAFRFLFFFFQLPAKQPRIETGSQAHLSVVFPLSATNFWLFFIYFFSQREKPLSPAGCRELKTLRLFEGEPTREELGREYHGCKWCTKCSPRPLSLHVSTGKQWFRLLFLGQA